MKLKQLAAKMVLSTKKNSPAILTAVGIIGLGATAYLAYKSREKVEAIVVGLEEAQDDEVVVNKAEVARDLVEALYLPVVVGAVSIASIVWSYKIQNNRIAVLATTLAAQQAKAYLFEQKYKQEHGDEAYAKFMAPVVKKDVTTVDGKGKEKITSENVQQDMHKSVGMWWEESLESVTDDHNYNMAMIDSLTEKLELKLFAKGTLLLNELYDVLGFERTRSGALLGWTAGDAFNIEKIVTVMLDETDGQMKERIWVTWATPKYIYGDVEFNGRYGL